MDLFSQLISCGQVLDYWELDPSQQLIYTTSSNSEILYAYFLMNPFKDDLLQHISNKKSSPIILYNNIGLSWIASPEIVNESICRIHMVGPAFTSDVSYLSLEKKLSQSDYPQSFIRQFMEHIRNIPIIAYPSWLRYGLMLHYCATGERLQMSDFCYSSSEFQTQYDPKSTPNPASATWYAEQLMMKMIEEGNPDFGKATTLLASSSVASVSRNNTSLLRQKFYCSAAVALSTRAAIRGGLEVSTAYLIGETYLNRIEEVSNLSELTQLTNLMYEDFIQRVHKVRQKAGLSPVIQACCTFIDVHYAEKISIQALADKVGYSDYYLAQKFKKEIGITIAQYIRDRRVEQGKLMLRASNRSIQDIAEALGFCNASYFSSAFKTVVGMTPAEYRKQTN